MGGTAFTTLSRTVGMEEAPVPSGVDALTAELVLFEELDGEDADAAAEALAELDGEGAAAEALAEPDEEQAAAGAAAAAGGTLCPPMPIAAAVDGTFKAQLVGKQMMHFECTLRCSRVTMEKLRAAIENRTSRKVGPLQCRFFFL